MKSFFFSTPVSAWGPSIGLLIHRLVFGGFMLVGHGWGKLMAFGEKAATFPDPLGIGNTASMAGAVFTEVVISALIVLGLGTRLAALPAIFTMAVAGFVIHADGPFFLPGQGAKEPAVLFMAGYVLLIFTGPGRISLDRVLGRKPA